MLSDNNFFLLFVNKIGIFTMSHLVMNNHFARALVSGIKTKHITPVVGSGWNPNDSDSVELLAYTDKKLGLQAFFNINGLELGVKSPLGDINEVTWIKESFYAKEQTWDQHHAPQPIIYEADMDINNELTEQGYLRLQAQIMPKWASRMSIKLTKIDVVKLQSLDDDTVTALGSYLDRCGCFSSGKKNPFMGAKFNQKWCAIHGDEFHDFWHKRFAKSEYAWDENPWVWLYDFDLIKEDVKTTE